LIYRDLGRTGLKVSVLGFGAMRLPMVGHGDDARVDRALAVPMIHRAFEAGVNYVDSAVMYCNHDSQRAVGDALKGWRDRVIVSTKNHYYGPDEKAWWKNLQDSLERLQVQTIDLYCFHGTNWKSYNEHIAPTMLAWMRQAKDQGLIRRICCSFHDNNDGLRKIIDTGFPEVITLQYNLLDRQLEDGIAYAHEKGVGIVVMGPVGGGSLAEPSEVLASLLPGIKRVPELALRFVLANPHVSTAISGMSTLQHVEENLRVACDTVSLTDSDKAAIEEHLVRMKGLAKLYCTGCGYCMPCASGVDIPAVFERFNRGRVYGLWDSARQAYARMGKDQWNKGKPADACADCGECEKKCPQKIQIRAQLKEAHAVLTVKKL